MSRFAVAVFIALWLPPGGAAPPQGWPAVEQIYHKQIQAAGIVGSSVLLMRDGAVVASAG